MKNKFILIIILFFLALRIVVAATNDCDFTKAEIITSKNTTCPDDEIVLFVDNITNCNRVPIEVYYTNSTGKNVTLCHAKIYNNSFACTFITPNIDVPSKTVSLWANISDKMIYLKAITINKRTNVYGCYDAYGNEIYCGDECSDKIISRKWEDVKAVSLPLHLTFGLDNSLDTSIPQNLDIPKNDSWVYTYPKFWLNDCGPISSTSCNFITCSKMLVKDNTIIGAMFGNPSWRDEGIINCSVSQSNLKDYYAPPNIFNSSGEKIVSKDDNFPNSGCNGSYTCGFEQHQINRYMYQWHVDYDLIAIAFSNEDYVPMFLGYNQTTDNPLGGCSGNSICYTEIPICGDGVCVPPAENCNSCPSDCLSKCNGKICTTCVAPNFADEYGCISKYKDYEEKCSTNCMCDQSKYYCAKRDGEEIGKCCFKDQELNASGNCELKRAINITAINLNIADGSYGNILNGKRYCCDWTNSIWVQFVLALKNNGKTDENVTVCVGFDGSGLSTVGETYCEDVFINRGESKIVILPKKGGGPSSFKCVYNTDPLEDGNLDKNIKDSILSKSYFYRINCTSPGTCTIPTSCSSSDSCGHQAMSIIISPKDATKCPEKDENCGIASPAKYKGRTLIKCDTKTGFCEDSSIGEIETNGFQVKGLWGGLANYYDFVLSPGALLSPFTRFVDCDPFHVGNNILETSSMEISDLKCYTALEGKVMDECRNGVPVNWP